MKLLTLLALTSLLFFDNTSTNNLADTSWTFIQLVDKKNNVTYLADVSCNATLSFSSNGQYSGYSGWNGFSGDYVIQKSNHIHLTDPIATKRAGPLKCKLGETLYIHYKNADTYLLSADTLKIFSSDTTEMVFSQRH